MKKVLPKKELRRGDSLDQVPIAPKKFSTSKVIKVMQQKPVSDDSDCTSSESDGDLSDEDPAIPSISNITDALTMKITFADQLVEVVNHIEHSPSLESVHLMDSTVPDFEKLADPGVIRSPTEATIFVNYAFKASIAQKKPSPVTQLRFLPSTNKICLSATASGILYIWDLMSQCLSFYFEAHAQTITDMDVSSGDLVVTASVDGKVKLWNVRERRSEYSWNVGVAVTACRFSQKYENRVIIGDAKGRIQQLTIGEQRAKVLAESRAAPEVTMDSITNILVLEHKIYASDKHGKLVSYLELESGKLQAYNMILANGPSKMLLLEANTLSLVKVFYHPQAAEVIRSTFSPDGELCITGSEDGNVYLFGTQSGSMINMLEHQKLPVNAVSISSDASRIVSATSSDICLWDIPVKKKSP